MRTAILAAAVLAAVAAPVAVQAQAAARRPSTPAAAPAYRLACAGPFSARTTEADLRRLFGAANVTRERVNTVEAEEANATVLFARDPSRRAEVFWIDDARHPGFSGLRTAGRAWTTQHGLRVGSPIADVQRVHGRPFNLSGFGWDYGGVPDFEGGRLAQPTAPGCHIGYDLVPAENANSTQALGEGTYRSDSAAVRSQRPQVGRITLSFEN